MSSSHGSEVPSFLRTVFHCRSLVRRSPVRRERWHATYALDLCCSSSHSHSCQPGSLLARQMTSGPGRRSCLLTKAGFRSLCAQNRLDAAVPRVCCAGRERSAGVPAKSLAYAVEPDSTNPRNQCGTQRVLSLFVVLDKAIRCRSKPSTPGSGGEIDHLCCPPPRSRQVSSRIHRARQNAYIRNLISYCVSGVWMSCLPCKVFQVTWDSHC